MDQKAIDRILKILALANSTTFDGEAAAARAMAEALIAKHNISLSEIEVEANPRNKIVVVEYTPFSTTAMWEQIIAHAVGDLCGCGTYYMHAPGSEEYTTFEFAGLVPNTEACLYILKEVHRQRKDAWFKYRAEGGPDSFGKFCFGFARGLEGKIRRLVTKSQIDERELAKLWFAQRNTVHTADPITGRASSGAGLGAGGTASLHRGTSGAAPPPLRIR